MAALSAIAGSVFCLIDAIAVLSGGQSVELNIPWQLPFGKVVFGLDPLSAIFVLPIAVVVAVAALYGVQYVKKSPGGMSVGGNWFFFNLLAAAMLSVVAARNGFLFLMCWEVMSLASFFLVISDYGSDSARRAGWIYLIAMHLGTACLLVLFLLLGRKSGSLDFAGFSAGSGDGGVVPAGRRRIRHESRIHSPARLAARGASGRAFARLGRDERRDDQDGHLRFASHADVSRRNAGLVGLDANGHRRGVGRAWRLVRPGPA